MKRYLKFAIPVVLLSLLCLSYRVVGIVGKLGSSSPAIITLRFFQIPLIFLIIGFLIAMFFYNHKPISGHYLTYRNSLKILLFSIFSYIFILFTLKFFKLYTYHYQIFDAGLYDHKLWRIANADFNKKFLIALFSGHFQPVILIYSISYHIKPTPLIPYFLETLALPSVAIPLYLLTYKKTNDYFLSLIVSITYLLYPPVGFNDILGFHPDHVYLLAMVWAFYFLEKDKYILLIISLLIACSASEPWIPGVSFFGIFMIFYKRKWFMGSLVSISSISFFTILLFYLMPHMGSTWSAKHIFSSNSYYTILLSGNIKKILLSMLNVQKGFFIFSLIGPFLLMPLLSPLALIVAIPDFSKSLLSQEPLHYAIDGHYTLGITATFFIAYIFSLRKIKIKYNLKLAQTISILVLIETLAFNIANSPMPISLNFWLKEGVPKAFYYKNYFSDKKTLALKEVDKIMPPDQNLKIELTNDIYTPHLVHRNIPIKLYPSPNWKVADYIILDLRSEFPAGNLSIKKAYRVNLHKAYAELLKDNTFKKVFDKSGIKIFKRLN